MTRGLDLRLALTDLANAAEPLTQARNRLQFEIRRFEVLLERYSAGSAAKTADLTVPPAAAAADERLDIAGKMLLPCADHIRRHTSPALTFGWLLGAAATVLLIPACYAVLEDLTAIAPAEEGIG